ncbi:4'-phosphopantetheinyl transferase [Micromonospora humidisoli]|uniref:4'-phosphopantetheinyl transferase superfamily protein n=1 Tax=Micromonospora humidisoli TaxID=2807622 RepID=A0ABS2JHE7_9ACTN|nr:MULTISPECIES: 4'-phosphopantetheinyl transferase superfamily protein [Micromonospora]MBM7085937.1 4'-phosphopantetheinyl transferase superfamily protein [Micromonospora humidisoli]GHJ09194.1 4'-phosphopantetheinyl transferase [Micromonospora sp. AKA109]
MIDRITPPGVVAVEAFDDTDTEPLHPAEAALVARAVEKRVREFTTARTCARRALRALGVPPAPVLTGERGAPVWPSGVVGSLTHCPGYRAAVVARAADVRAIGIDAEPDAALPDGVLDAIALPEERAMVDRLATDAPGPHWDRLLFSAKESLYKAWFPITGIFLGFDEARIVLHPTDRTFAARVLVPGRGRDFDGRYLHDAGLTLTVVAVPH